MPYDENDKAGQVPAPDLRADGGAVHEDAQAAGREVLDLPAPAKARKKSPRRSRSQDGSSQGAAELPVQPPAAGARKRKPRATPEGSGVPRERVRRAKAVKPKKVKAPVLFDFYDGRRANMTTLRSAPGKPKYITLTEWPDSLLGAYKAQILTGLALMEAERIAGDQVRQIQLVTKGHPTDHAPGCQEEG